MAETTVIRNDEASRYEIQVDGALAGFMDTEDRGGKTLITHTEVLDEFQGQGLAGILVREALGDLATTGETVIPLCPYVQGFLRKNEVAGLAVEWPDRDPA